MRGENVSARKVKEKKINNTEMEIVSNCLQVTQILKCMLLTADIECQSD